MSSLERGGGSGKFESEGEGFQNILKEADKNQNRVTKSPKGC